MTYTIFRLIIGAMLLYSAYEILAGKQGVHQFAKWRRIWRAALRPSSIGWALITIPLTSVAAVGLYMLGGPMQWGWMSLLSHGEQSGNAAVSYDGSILSIVILALVIVLLPFLAHSEEETFRRDQHTLGQILKSNCIFGPLHLLMGIPIAVGIALILPGLIWSYVYLRAWKKSVAADENASFEFKPTDDMSIDEFGVAFEKFAKAHIGSYHMNKATMTAAGAHLAHNAFAISIAVIAWIYLV